MRTGVVTDLAIVPVYLTKAGSTTETERLSERTGSESSAGCIGWLLATSHSTGAIQIWDPRDGGLQVLSTMAPPTPADGACR